MDYRPLGLSGITVSELCLGAMMFGQFGNTNREECVRIVHRALDAGINFVNSADGYSGGEAEEILGEALKNGRREDVIISTKTGLKIDGMPNQGGGSRRWLTKAIEGTLTRLQTDYIDVYELGVPDPLTDIDETLGAMTDLVTAGKVRTFGTSKMTPSALVHAHAVAERRGHGYFRVEESPYSMLTRAIEYDLLPTAARLGTGVVAFAALAGGWLSGKYRKNVEVSAPGSPFRGRGGRMDATNPANAAKLEAADALGTLADESGLTLVQLATAFALTHPAVSSVIVGPRTPDQLEGYLQADGLTLTTPILDRIDEIVPPASTVSITDNMWMVGNTTLEVANRRR